ncbi:biopolymer transporter ExbD [Hymenobacter sp. 5317J-9]|uniref:biopolymer transporter ExbD n=1 Tax=Hymenobacter sp. 5317J-9 TaxID=2932250 RepID=UPI001FD68A43|nr:biopolymer transporter ExbD [Hymenobacter sp. 5317J-9]UOQ96358.1 biopolymer transporter ExbD [Hymenobacter sp. 5317J-9]
MAAIKSRVTAADKRGISLPDIAPFSGIMLLTVGFFLLGRFQNPTDEAVATEQLPTSSTWYCKLPDDPRAIISLNGKKQLAFAVTSQTIQTAAIKTVALHHHVRLTAAQLTELATLPYLDTNVESIDAYLAMPVRQRNRAYQSNTFTPLSEAELMECISAAKDASETLLHRPVYIALRITPEVKMPEVYRLTDLLQARGINRFDLATQFQSLKTE